MTWLPFAIRTLNFWRNSSGYRTSGLAPTHPHILQGMEIIYTVGWNGLQRNEFISYSTWYKYWNTFLFCSMAKPSDEEMDLAQKVRDNLVEMSAKVQPRFVASSAGIRKAIGASDLPL